MAPLAVLSPREASIFACLADTVVAPEPVLPPVRETDAVAFFDRWMARAPRLNRIGLRALLYALETGAAARSGSARGCGGSRRSGAPSTCARSSRTGSRSCASWRS